MANSTNLVKKTAASIVKTKATESEVVKQAPTFRPLYQQIKDLITQGLHSLEWKPGQSIPSEMELAARFQVSQGTVRKAIDELAAENRLVRRQGKGTFVATHAENATQYRFLRLLTNDKSTPTLNRRFIHCNRVKAPSHVASALGLKAGESVLKILRLLSDQKKPIVLDEIWLPSQFFKGLTAERLSAYQGPMYALFETEFGVQMVNATEQIRAVNASASAGQQLQIPENTALLSVERLSYTYANQPVELRIGLYLTSHHYYHNELG